MELHNGAGATTSASRQRRRAPIACKTCHERKVRCTVAQSGPPCTNCVHDGIVCVVPPRGRLMARKTQLRLHTSEPEVTEDVTRPVRPVPTPIPPPPAWSEEPTLSPLAEHLWSPESSSPSVNLAVEGRLRSEAEKQTNNIATANSTEVVTVRDEGENSASYAAVLEDNVAENDAAPFYVGDQQGLGFVFDICKPNRSPKGNHYRVPRAAANSLPPEVLTLLCMKGVFSLPDKEVCQELFRCYFYYVHPFLPIINASDVLSQYLKGAVQKSSLLLIWSMFFAATNFVDSDLLKKVGYPSRKAMKRAMYRRAKSLYDADYEQDKICLIQSVILMAFWYVDTEDRNGSWHWIGVAISLCQTIGLHRDPEADQQHQPRRPSSQRFLWRRIWWSCFFRDTWLSLGMGRPRRIDPLDCDTPMPSANDVLAELTDIPSDIKDFYIPADVAPLAQSFINLLRLSTALSNVLSIHYRPGKVLPSSREIEMDEREVFKCAEGCRGAGQGSSRITELHLYQLQLYYEATVIALYRPYILHSPSDIAAPQEETWRCKALQKTKVAASNSNVVLNKLMTMDLVNLCQSITVTALIPTMQIHLLESSSSNLLVRRLAQNHLDLCMIVIDELRATYWAADFIFSLFSKARSKLAQKGTATRTVDVELGRAEPLTPDSAMHTEALSLTEPGIEELLLPNEFLSNGWNPFSCTLEDPSAVSYPELDFDVNSLFVMGDLNGSNDNGI